MKTINFPKILSIQTTSLCNASCVFCPYQDIKNLFPKQIMDLDLYARIIDESNSYKHIERIIVYMNNEPLTDPHLIERINYAKEKVPWASVHILTNGSLLTEELSQDLINSKLDWIGFSLHGIEKRTIEKAMGLPYERTFKMVNRFIEKAKTKKSIENYIMLTFLKHQYLSIDEKSEAVKYWQDRGIKRISYFDGPISRAGNVKNLPQVKHTEVKGCNSIWWDKMIHIVENGDVILCCMDWRREVKLGNLRKQSIYEIWNGKIYQNVRKMVYGEKDSPENFICKRCEQAKLGIEKKDFNVRKKNPNILLVICPSWGINTPPLGLASISSYLKNRGIDVEILDLNIEIYHRVSLKLKKMWEMDSSYLWWISSLFIKKSNLY